MFEAPERHAHSFVQEGSDQENVDRVSRSVGSLAGGPIEGRQIGSALDRSHSRMPKSRLGKDGPREGPTDIELLKERFAKLLLGEDMSGGGKGVSSALALSNAITNLAASVFGEQHKLEPMSAERKVRWRREIDWLLSVTDYIVEFVAKEQVTDDGIKIEVMGTQQRRDLLMNIPALRKLDAMLIVRHPNTVLHCYNAQGYLDNFKDQNEFSYVKRDASDEEKGSGKRQDEKWWLPTVKVPPNGLSEVSKKWLLFQKESVNQVLKAAMAINAQVLMEMEIPDAYIESLPKNGRASLGDSIYKAITVENFDPESLLSSIDLSTEHKVLDLKNRIEASIVIWKRKMHNKDGKSSWGSTVSLEKREQFEERAETILHLLKHRFPGIPQSALDISKIQFNRDVGQAVLESYSRILESLAYTVMSRIEDVLYADSAAQGEKVERRHAATDGGVIKKLDPKEELEKLNNMDVPMTLSDFMGWHEEVKEEAVEKKEEGIMKKPPNVATKKFCSYIEKLENLGGLRSPTARH